jgi:ketosteroid isomerase-like protein
MRRPVHARTIARIVLLIVLTALARPAMAQWVRSHDQFYMPASHNWAFRDNYRAADRLFNAFDYGHAILYETLYRKPNAATSVLEVDEYDFITKRLLVNPPRLPLEENAIEVAYAKLVPEAKQMFDWAHLLHRQIYDVWADESIPLAAKDARIEELLRYYGARRDLAFSTQPKTMELMEGQYYATAFREKYPKFNGLIWAYHWLQVGLYEPLIIAQTADERQTGVTAAVSRFWQMLEDPPNQMPRIMPMTAAVAPEFARRYPEAAIIFDNLHSMHDVISDILASPEVPREKKRQEILTAAARYRDGTSFVMPVEEWREMAVMMGVENMGGPAVGFLAALPEATVPRGAVMAHMHHAPAPRADSVTAATEAIAAAHAHHAATPRTEQPAQEEAAVRAVATAFGNALETGDSTAALALLHPDVVIFEGGSWETLEDYRSGHLRADMRYLQATQQETLRAVVHVSGDQALVTREFSTTGTMGERVIDSIGVETLILVRTDEGWKIRHIHWSSRARQRRPG